MRSLSLSWIAIMLLFVSSLKKNRSKNFLRKFYKIFFYLVFCIWLGWIGSYFYVNLKNHLILKEWVTLNYFFSICKLTLSFSANSAELSQKLMKYWYFHKTNLKLIGDRLKGSHYLKSFLNERNIEFRKAIVKFYINHWITNMK